MFRVSGRQQSLPAKVVPIIWTSFRYSNTTRWCKEGNERFQRMFVAF